jgi:hypothetical protein
MDINLYASKINHTKKYKKICRAGINFFSSVYHFEPVNALIKACQKIYLKNKGYGPHEIRFILMIHGAIMRGTLRKEARRCREQ